MTDKQSDYRKELLKNIHLTKAYQIKRENDAWQDFLHINFGVETSAKLGIDELKSLLDYLRGQGALIKSEKSRDIYKHQARKTANKKRRDSSQAQNDKGGAKNDRGGEIAGRSSRTRPRARYCEEARNDSNRRNDKGGYCTSKQIYTIDQLWQAKARQKDELSLRNFINRIVDKRPLNLNSLTNSEAQKVIIALGKLK
ncbi:hypothetical protein FACS189487_05720 [Campylobacterota bacterium]|nr:hypothetical protein FACS189487_05720 [Campylobacterota bacterium]